ncbi:hypothetical protein HKK55_10900 [Pseudomonas sp. ADAK18]|uniref:Kelch repeat-containing protein n=1 Tax=Pseudomonas sp. ADAK18 TaxID=2730848 RepID=UPI0014630231|nr:kelch repeat-containing protein [Pseudomonas sp. ADAK18]QJI29198.1 hypothetical protein HKK55_10900 [Pseudomonas sp. ADAK18]
MSTLTPDGFMPTGSMLEPRYFHSAIAITDCGVLVFSGSGVGQRIVRRFDKTLPGLCDTSQNPRAMTRVEFYDQHLETWSAVAPLPVLRRSCGAVLLPSGLVLVVGGSGTAHALSDTQLYDPSENCWTLTGQLHTPRFSHTTTLLASNQVLVTGGNNLQQGSGQVQDSVELYTPETGQWQRETWLSVDCMNHTATRLLTDEVLVVGGFSGRRNAALTTAFIYNPTTHLWAAVQPLPAPRMQHTATLLEDGRVLIAGGTDEPFGPAQNLAFIYDPTLNQWEPTTMNVSRKGHTATRLVTGKVLVVGNSSTSDPVSARTAELFDPASGQWSLTGELHDGRFEHSASSLSSGQVLIAGGGRPTSHPAPLSTAELYTPG